MRILVVDDKALIGDALRALLEARGHRVVGTAEPSDAIRLARIHLPNVILVDMDGPIQAFIETTRGVSSAAPDAAVVVVTDSPDEELLFQALRAGARGYLTKDLHADRFCSLLEGIERGEPALTPGLARRLVEAFGGDAPTTPGRGHGHLTDREVEILSAMTGGATSNRMLAKALSVSENTVRFHIRNILAKLHLHSRTAAVAWALTHGVVPAGSRGS